MKTNLALLSILTVLVFVGCSKRSDNGTVASGDTPEQVNPQPPEQVNPQPRPATGTSRPIEGALPERAVNAQKARVRSRNMTFEQFKATVWREPDALGGKYLVNGDRPILNEKHLEEFFENEVKKDPESRAMRDFSRQLVVNTVGGQDDLWNTTMQRQLTYCVSDAFGSHYQAVVAAMDAATQAWEDAADIDFIHDPAQDNSCTAGNPDIVFDIRPVNVNGNYLARAFFPNEPRAARNVLIDNSAFNLSGNLTLVGILRHELGHTLGFRHEHTRPEAGACFEDNDWRPVTDYDAFSVMHYPQCNGAGDWTLTLTVMDENGAACVYGPASDFTFDPNINLQDCREQVSSSCAPQTETIQDSVNRRQEKLYGPFAVTPGTTFEVVMTGSGDPDLYVRFDQAPTMAFYDCRPYLNGANETCSLTVPSGESTAHVMVRGYTAGSYTLKITHAAATP